MMDDQRRGVPVMRKSAKEISQEKSSHKNSIVEKLTAKSYIIYVFNIAECPSLLGSLLFHR